MGFSSTKHFKSLEFCGEVAQSDQLSFLHRGRCTPFIADAKPFAATDLPIFRVSQGIRGLGSLQCGGRLKRDAAALNSYLVYEVEYRYIFCFL